MRIGFFTNNYLPRQTGVSHSIENLRQELEALGHDVFIFAPRYRKKRKSTNKIFRYKSIRTHKKLGPLRSIPFPHSGKIKKHIKKLGLDIIHSHHPYLLGKTAQKYAEELGIPLVFTIHTPYYQYPQHLLGGIGKFVDSILFEAIIKYTNKCDLAIVPTKAVQVNLSKASISPPVKIIPAGIDRKKFTELDKQEARKKLKIKSNAQVLLIVGRLTYEKNISFLIESFKEISKKNKKALLIIVGGGPNRLALKSLSKNLGLEKKIIFTKRLPYKKLPSFYAAADIFVYSSLVDTQGLVLCEAMAAGLPIVSTNQAMGPRSIVKNNKIGYLVKPDIRTFSKKILYLLDHKSKLKDFSDAALEESRSYDRHLLAKKLEKAYKNILKNG